MNTYLLGYILLLHFLWAIMAVHQNILQHGYKEWKIHSACFMINFISAPIAILFAIFNSKKFSK